jgi:Flp pilus assembly protein TadG
MMRVFRALKDERGVAALEFALILPILVAVVLFGLDGWMRINQVTQMRSAVQAGSRYYQSGGSDDTAAAQLALAAWNHAPGDAAVNTARSCTCNGVGASCSSLCADQTLPKTFVTLTATGGYSDPMVGSQTLTETGVVRVR